MTKKPITSASPADAPPVEPKPAATDPNSVRVRAIASFEGLEGDKSPRSPPFEVNRQRYADLKANNLVELA